MVNAKPVQAAVIAILGLASPNAEAASDVRVIEVALPRAAYPNEAVELAVQAGVLARGAEVDVTTPSGAHIGTISPFAIRDHRPAGTYSFPLNSSMIHDGLVTVYLSVKRHGMPPRAPTPDEVKDVSVVFTRVAP